MVSQFKVSHKQKINFHPRDVFLLFWWDGFFFVKEAKNYNSFSIDGEAPLDE